MNYNKSGLWILLVGISVSFICFFYVVFFSPPIKLAELEGESKPETQTEDPSTLSATASQKLSAGADSSATAKQAQNIWISSPAGVTQGGKVYQTYCFTCHGSKGLGDGPAGGALKPPPRDLVKGDWQQGGSSIALYKTLAQGIEGTSMVSFSYLSKEDRWALVHYIRSLTQNKVKDDPKELEKFAKTAP